MTNRILKLSTLLFSVFLFLSCDSDDDNATPNGSTSSECIFSDTDPFFNGDINGIDSCIVFNGFNIANGFSSSGSSSRGTIFGSFLSTVNISGGTPLSTTIGINKGSFDGDRENLPNFFSLGRFGFSDPADGYQLYMQEVNSPTEVIDFFTRPSSPTADNFIEIVDIQDVSNEFLTAVLVEANVNATLFSESGESRTVTNGRIRLLFR